MIIIVIVDLLDARLHQVLGAVVASLIADYSDINGDNADPLFAFLATEKPLGCSYQFNWKFFKLSATKCCS